MSVDLEWWRNPPPILEDYNDALKNYILYPDISIHNPEPVFFQYIPDLDDLFYVPPCPATTTLMPERCLVTNEIINFVEVPVEDAGCTSKNSMSLKREPIANEKSTRGSSSNYPFWPGGFDEPEDEIKELVIDNYDFENNLMTVAPGFTTGLDFKKTHNNSTEKDNENTIIADVTVDLLSIIDNDHDIIGLWNKETDTSIKITSDNQIVLTSEIDELIETVDDIVLDISKTNTTDKLSSEWAEMLDVTKPVDDFNIRIPDPAQKYPFELDTFQKQAILKLEEHHHVFVAAHTSAGKTVVAEYAIALSKKHLTRTIYTSPIKALSNQKYRDFKKKYDDVGLITGDFQIDPLSSCLIMTTEILRSMLYCGSDVTRDLEYVIFDEVHYITDADRGHVWEEVLILLPDHVNIVMLSATVPNTIEFANWVGRTKKKKVYVVSTQKRPIPLRHYLYTGCGGKSKNDIFLIVDDNKFLQSGYEAAVNAKMNSKQTDNSNRMNLNRNQEKTLWVGLIDYLKRNNKLPVVAFTLSQNRCNLNALSLQSCDLTTAKEKSRIHRFYHRCIKNLKEADRLLPQIITMEDTLKRGIAIHHSGILPILKEIVEMLFAEGLVKLLFATETFAMGVNMPARTVIFDNYMKYDGIEVRDLLPAEYIQMAGRAGRRGHDETGTVILLCKTKVPKQEILNNMILGKPMRLISKFRLTYTMILNLLRVERVTVEDMISHSFREHKKQLQVPENKKKIQDTECEITKLQDMNDYMKPLSEFYDIAYQYIMEWLEVMPFLINQPKNNRELKPGRVLIVSHKQHFNKLGILLSVVTSQIKETIYKVLVLDHQNSYASINSINLKENSNWLTNDIDNQEDDQNDIWFRMLALIPDNQKFIPEGIGGHCLLSVKANQIKEITKITIKVEYDKIIQNCEQRLIPRFKDSPPGENVKKAVTDLYNLNQSVLNNKVKLNCVNLETGIILTNIDNAKPLKNLNELKKNMEKYLTYTNIANFSDEFLLIFKRKKLEKQRDDLLLKISNKGLSLYPEYCNNLRVLQELNYINEHEDNIVTMKGRVACEIGTNELIITELILQNKLTNLDPCEIAALLSSLVFQAKTAIDLRTDLWPKLTDSLKLSIEAIEDVEKKITATERKFDVDRYDTTKDILNFGLVEVTYEWARNKPFSLIMELTDVQEGIIVRCIQQLHEILCNVKDAARIIGDTFLQQKMQDASNAIKRDIVFAASLYTQNDNTINFD